MVTTLTIAQVIVEAARYGCVVRPVQEYIIRGEDLQGGTVKVKRLIEPSMSLAFPIAHVDSPWVVMPKTAR